MFSVRRLSRPRAQGITVLSSCQAVSVDLDQKFLKVKRVNVRGNGQLDLGDTIKASIYFSRPDVVDTESSVGQYNIYICIHMRRTWVDHHYLNADVWIG